MIVKPRTLLATQCRISSRCIKAHLLLLQHINGTGCGIKHTAEIIMGGQTNCNTPYPGLSCSLSGGCCKIIFFVVLVCDRNGTGHLGSPDHRACWKLFAGPLIFCMIMMSPTIWLFEKSQWAVNELRRMHLTMPSLGIIDLGKNCCVGY